MRQAGAIAKDRLSRPGRGGLRDQLPRLLLITVSVGFLCVLLIAPIVLVFSTALSNGWQAYLDALREPDTAAAIRLTLTVAAIVVPLNTLFGLAAAWCIANFDFRGKSLLLTVIDLPLAVSPVVAGLVYVLLFGLQGWFGLWLQEQGISIIFAVPGIVLATLFVTLPYVAREIVPLMQQLGREEEEVAATLGAGGLRTFVQITLPKIRWALLNGILLCNARAMGEFGAVAIVSGHIRGLTTTMPLHVEILFNEYNLTAAFAVASLLSLLALLTLVSKSVLEFRQRSGRSNA